MVKRPHASLDSAGSGRASSRSEAKRARAHALGSTRSQARSSRALSLEGSLSEEVLLRVLSFLDAKDLLSVARVSPAWYRLAQDGQLWRPLYLSTFAPSRTAHEGLGGNSPPSSRSRPWRELYKISSNWRRGSARSKNLLGPAVRKTILAEAPGSLALAEEGTSALSTARTASASAGGTSSWTVPPSSWTSRRQDRKDVRPEPELLLQFRDCFFLTAQRNSPGPSPQGHPLVPSVSVLQTLPEGGSTLIGSIRSPSLAAFWENHPPPTEGVAVTELRLDDAHEGAARGEERASETARVAVFLSTGQLSLFTLHLPTSSTSFSAREVYSNLSLVNPPPTFPLPLAPPSHHLATAAQTFDPTILARWNGGVMVTFSQQSVLRFWTVREGKEGWQVEQAAGSMRTHECFAPFVLNLHRIPAPHSPQDSNHWPSSNEVKDTEEYRVTVSYATPIFPSAWTIGVQEFQSSLSPTGRMKMTQARHAVAKLDGVGDHSLVTAIECATPYVVASRDNNTIDVYELVRETPVKEHKSFTRRAGSSLHKSGRLRMKSTAPPGPGPLPPRHPHKRDSSERVELLHRRTLFGHTGAVQSVALQGDKCVSAGADGQVKIWDLAPLGSTNERGKARGREEGVVTVVEEQSSPSAAMDDLSSAVSAEGRVPGRVERVWFDEEQIVSLVQGEGVRLLRFD